MEFDPKTALSVLLGVAGALRTVTQLAEAVNALAGELVDGDEPASGPVPPCIKLDDLAPLFVLLAELEAAAERLKVKSPVLRELQRQARRASKARDASRHGMAHYEQDEVPSDDGAEV